MTILIITNGLSTIAGIGGGALGLIIFMLGFDYTPKDATLVVLCSIFGASTGNILNLMRKAFNGRPLINYRHVLLLIAIIFTGSFVGILLNKYLPSVGICSMILFIRVISVKKSYRRFR